MIDFVRAAEVLSDLSDVPFQCEGSSVVSEDRRWAFTVLPIKSPASILKIQVDDPARTLLILPAMTTRGRQYARKLRLSWVDYLGNADVRAPGFLVRSSKEKPRTSIGRPSTVGTAIASRVIRTLLEDPARWWKQAHLAHAAELSPSLLFTLLRREGLSGTLEWEAKRLRPRDPSALLAVWGREYDFHSQHRVLRCRMEGRSGIEVAANLTRVLRNTDLRWAMTGLSAAWMYDQHADFGIASAYVEGRVDLRAAGLSLAERDGNVWIITPAHPYVFSGMRNVDGVPCVSPVQVWADLQGHPQRAFEAAASLLENVVVPAWDSSDG